jgi:hypothetical protein
MIFNSIEEIQVLDPKKQNKPYEINTIHYYQLLLLHVLAFMLALQVFSFQRSEAQPSITSRHNLQKSF